MRLVLAGAWLLLTAALLLSPAPLGLTVLVAVVVGLLFFTAGCMWRLGDES